MCFRRTGPVTKTILIENGFLVTLGDSNELIKNGSILIEDNKIKNFGEAPDLTGEDFDYNIDASGSIIMPGFINTHHHLYSTFARGLNTPGKPPMDFIEILDKLWWTLDEKLDKESIYYSALIPLIECIKSGTTTIIDHHESQSYQKNSLSEIAKAVEKAGIRASLCLGTSDRYGRGMDGLNENKRFLKELKRNPSELINGMVGLHASFTVNNETLEKSVKLAKENDVGIHIHCAEDKYDQDKTLKDYGERVVKRLKSHDALGEKSILVHGVHVNEEELDIISKTDTNIIHNPESNMNNAVGYADVPKMMEKDIRVGLGTDGMSSNMLSQMRCAYLLHPHAKKDPRIGFSEAPKMLLENNREIISKGSEWNIGEIKKGSHADVVIIDYHPPTPLNEDTFLSHLIFGLVNAPVDTTICNGDILMENKKLTSMDEEKIAGKASKVASKIWRKIQ